jgi:hypothetical protein
VILKIYLVRHPKKKDDDKRPGPSDNPAKDTPETTGPAQTDESRIKKGLDKIFWLRVGLGILAGTLSAELGITMQHAHDKGYTGLGIAIALFIISYGIAKSLRVPLPPSDKRKLIMTGIGSYFLMFLFSWILVNTLIHPDVGILNVR